MTITELRVVCEKDKIVHSIYSYKKFCGEHIHSLDADPDLMANYLSADRYLRFMNFMKPETFEDFIKDLFRMIEENMPSISGLDPQDALRVAYWFAEAQLALVTTSHHTLFEAFCKINQRSQEETVLKKNRRNLRFKQ